MQTVKVYSPIEDKEIRKNLNNSPIWKLAYHNDEYKSFVSNHPNMFEYTIKFDGLKPMQVTKVMKIQK